MSEPREIAISYETIKDATLEVVEWGEKVQTFLLRRYPNRHVYSCYIMFTPAGIIIAGDLRITNRGVICPYYGLDWFASRLSYDYLAEKFLDTNRHGHYDRAEVGWLSAIQRRFYELYPALMAAREAEGA